ncbi:TlpA disulfide reductase family protein [Sphingobacterium sp. xlx-130]|uniref:TlpA disulfide reductase family protein n=1 Tax=Sphingobacterium sp. xlx-130 TaxID=2654323 RepID=UPI0013D94D8A|nr:TlpA disulfide reductase family protein [Sphingobacterium sp. xlx-130]
MKNLRINLLLYLIIITPLLISSKLGTGSFTIKGRVEAVYEGGTVAVLVNYKFDTLATSIIQNGEFQFTGNIVEPTKAMVFIKNIRGEFILENDTYEVEFKGSDVKILGGQINSIVYGYKLDKDFLQINREAAEAEKVFNGLNMMDEKAVLNARASYNEKQRPVMKFIEDYQHGIIEGNYSVWAKLFTLSNNNNWRSYDSDKRLYLYDQYEKQIGKNDFIAKLRERIDNMIKSENARKAVAAGQPFREVLSKMKDGKEIKLSDVVARNQYTLLEFWASWCGPCRGEFPHLKKSYEKYKNRGFEIYALSLDEKHSDWLRALEEEQVPWINTVDPAGFKSKSASSYVIHGIPASFLISKDGTIVASGSEIRGFALDRKLKELFEG